MLPLVPHFRISYRVYYFFFPPKHKLLSLEEYILQGSEETSLALEHLREYCNSPDCNAWKTISRLKHPQRYDSMYYFSFYNTTTINPLTLPNQVATFRRRRHGVSLALATGGFVPVVTGSTPRLRL